MIKKSRKIEGFNLNECKFSQFIKRKIKFKNLISSLSEFKKYWNWNEGSRLIFYYIEPSICDNQKCFKNNRNIFPLFNTFFWLWEIKCENI